MACPKNIEAAKTATELAHYLDKRGPGDPQRLFERWPELVRLRYTEAKRAKRLCEAHEVWVDQIHSFTPSMILGILQSRDAGQAPIVDHDGDDVDAVLNRGRQ